MREAMLFKKLPESSVCCNLCAHRCVIKDGKKGICQVRENQGGTLYTLVYGHILWQRGRQGGAPQPLPGVARALRFAREREHIVGEQIKV